MLNPKGFSRQWMILIGGDLAVAIGCTYASMAIVMWWGLGAPVSAALPRIAAKFGFLSVFALYLGDLYKLDAPYSWSRVARRVAYAQAIIMVLAPVLLFFEPDAVFGRRFFVTYNFVSTPVMLTWRIVATRIFADRIHVGVAIVGAGEAAAMIAREVARHAHLGYTFVCFVTGYTKAQMNESSINIHANSGAAAPIPVRGINELGSLPNLRIVAVARDAVGRLPCEEFIKLRLSGVEVMSLEALYERVTGRLPTQLLDEAWFALAQGFSQSRLASALKRGVDVALGAVLSLAAAPIALAAALAIKLDSPGPIFYRQERVGPYGRTFSLIKFRSMLADAERLTGAVWATDRDPRITRVGKWLRKWRIDEVPQFFNVLRGEMSIVGPRPERPEIVARLCDEIPFYEYRHLVRPGLTGWAQVCYPYGATVADAGEKLCYDLYYMKNWSLGFDLQIMLQTFKVVLFGRGSR